MMRKFLTAFSLLIGMASLGHSQVMTNAQAVKITVPYQTTCSSSTIGTTATEMSGNTSLPSTTAGVSSIMIMNMDSAQTVCCNHSSGVTCTLGDSTYGVPISGTSGQKNFLEWSISAMQKWYCAGSGASVSVQTCKIR